jgi:hypothetical protein
VARRPKPQTQRNRERATTAAAMSKAMRDAAHGAMKVPPYVKLSPADVPFWRGIIFSRARDEWTQADLVVAAQLARCQRHIEEESETLEAVDTVIQNRKGTMVVNPRLAVIEHLARRELALMRALRIAGSQVGDARAEKTRRKLEADARKLSAKLGDGLLALPGPELEAGHA